MLFSNTYRDGGVFSTINLAFLLVFVILNVTATPYNAATVEEDAPASVKSLFPDRKTCGISFQDKIFGGNATELDEFPWLAALEYIKADGKKAHYCGGALITSRYVLTAAHCLVGPPNEARPKLVNIRLGEWNLETEEDCSEGVCSDPPQVVPVESVLIHEEYEIARIHSPNDIALVRLERPVTFSHYVSPICLPLIDEDVAKKSYVGQSLMVAGWGKTEHAARSAVKLKVPVSVVERSSCASIYKGAGVNVIESQLCAGGKKNEDSCRGDSGGPLMVQDVKGKDANWFAAALVSFGPQLCGTEGYPGVYTDLSKFGPWISENVKA